MSLSVMQKSGFKIQLLFSFLLLLYLLQFNLTQYSVNRVSKNSPFLKLFLTVTCAGFLLHTETSGGLAKPWCAFIFNNFKHLCVCLQVI